MNSTLAAELYDSLAYDGRGEITRDGRTWTITVERDDIPPMEQINDADCWGKVAWTDVDRDTGNDKRPAGFTRAAHKVNVRGYATEGTVWWQPPSGEMAVPAEMINELKAEVTRLLADGFVMVHVECGEDSASLCDIDSLDNGYGLLVVNDLIHEIKYEQTQREITRVRGLDTIGAAIR